MTGGIEGMNAPSGSSGIHLHGKNAQGPAAVVGKGKGTAQEGDAFEDVGDNTGRMMNSLGMANMVIFKRPQSMALALTNPEPPPLEPTAAAMTRSQTPK